MKHPLRTLLRELFVDPILGLLRIRRPQRLEIAAKKHPKERETRMPTVAASPEDLLHRVCLQREVIRKKT